MLTQIGIGIVACLSYNMLLGQGGMLSFGHAVYTGLGTFVAVHAMLGIADRSFPVPMSLVPIVGGFAGMFFAALLGYVTTKKAGTPFAMITLGIGELVAPMVLIVPEFFGGEGGIAVNRTAGPPVLGITFGPQIQVYYLIAIYTFVCTAAMFAFTRTPLGRVLNAVRDNPERVEFIGYSTQRVRYFSFVIAGFFAGIAGGMSAVHFEIATPDVVGAGALGRLPAVHLSRRRDLLLRADHRRGADGRRLRLVLRGHQGLAALPRPDLHVHGDVRAGRHRQPADDERARRRAPQAAPPLGLRTRCSRRRRS